MATFAIVDEGIVVNTIEAEAEIAAELGAIACPDGFGIGDGFDGEEWTKAPQPEPPPPPEPTAEELLAAFMEGYVNG
ncbi:hypothetical protein LJC34_05480 [Oscillospiraceae bacterium OttesenSCG-928-G22]|nr:hypothetical protein [Oscillospiraceae bacterium OttesenSCG-928-G22]